MAPGSVVKKVAISKKGFFNIFYELDPVCLVSSILLTLSPFFCLFFFLVYLTAGTVLFKSVCTVMNMKFQKSKKFQKSEPPIRIYLFKGNNENTNTVSEICLKLTIKTPERR